MLRSAKMKPSANRQENHSQQLVREALKRQVRDLSAFDAREPFFVCNLDHITRQYRKWEHFMPQTKPFYAVKCNPDAAVIKQLADLGSGFDCATKFEISLVLQQGIKPDKILFAHPCKSRACLEYARENGITQMTFDNASELHKVSNLFPEAELYLRIKADDSTAICRLGEKFGAPPEESRELLELAKSLHLNIVGLSFHVGSGASDPKSFQAAICDAQKAWSYASNLGFRLHTLDIGGGFSQNTISNMAPVIEEALTDYFADMTYRLIAEPGRYFAEGAYTLACQVIGKRQSSRSEYDRKPWTTLYVNDGVYGDFSAVVFEKAVPVPQILKKGSQYFPRSFLEAHGQEEQGCTIFGPTCDSIDCIRKSCRLPPSIEVGDWLYFQDMGAYSIACSTTFNGISNAREITYVKSRANKCK